MPWGRLNDKGNDDDKLLALSDAAWRMWGCGLIYCQNKLTDGFIPEHAINTFGVRAPNKNRVAKELCTSLVAGKGPLWHKVDGGYRVHDYLDWNPSREKVLADRQRHQDRTERYRERLRDASQDASQANFNGIGDPSRAGGCDDGSQVPRTTDPELPRTIRDPRTTSVSEKAAPAARLSPQVITGRDVERITAIVARELIPLGVPDSDLPHATKDLCRRYQIPHDSQSVRKAIDSAQVRARLPKRVGFRS